MTRFQFAIAVCAVLGAYLILVLWKKPVSGTGKFALKLSLVNLISWILFLPLNPLGHPPPQVMFGLILWLINSPLLVALVVMVWKCAKEREESKVFLATLTMYVALNMFMLWIVPAVELLLIS